MEVLFVLKDVQAVVLQVLAGSQHVMQQSDCMT